MNINFMTQNAVPSLTIFRKDLINYFTKKEQKVFVFANDYITESREIASKLLAIPVNCSLKKGGVNIHEMFF